MTIDTVLNSVELFSQHKISGEEFALTFNDYYGKYFDYAEVNGRDPELAKTLEEINEHVSRFEPNTTLRKEQPDYYLDENELLKNVLVLLRYKK